MRCRFSFEFYVLAGRRKLTIQDTWVWQKLGDKIFIPHFYYTSSQKRAVQEAYFSWWLKWNCVAGFGKQRQVKYVNEGVTIFWRKKKRKSESQEENDERQGDGLSLEDLEGCRQEELWLPIGSGSVGVQFAKMRVSE